MEQYIGKSRETARFALWFPWLGLARKTSSYNTQSRTLPRVLTVSTMPLLLYESACLLPLARILRKSLPITKKVQQRD
eukprot:49930-Amphidinium_carterae.1